MAPAAGGATLSRPPPRHRTTTCEIEQSRVRHRLAQAATRLDGAFGIEQRRECRNERRRRPRGHFGDHRVLFLPENWRACAIDGVARRLAGIDRSAQCQQLCHPAIDGAQRDDTKAVAEPCEQIGGKC